jgi:hypothetical protein
MILKIINSVLILFAAYMGVKQGWAMFTGKAEMLDMFGKWNIGKSGVMILGLFTLLSVILMLIPKTFVWGNFLMAAGILVIICFHFADKDLKGVMIELPFFLLSLLIIYLQYPFTKIA